MKTMILGAQGRVGRCLVAGVETAEDLTLAGALDAEDNLDESLQEYRPVVAIDFTTPDTVFSNVTTLLNAGIHAVVGTTGMSAKQLETLDSVARANDVGCLVAPNFALGAVLMMRFAEEAAKHLPWVEVVERHHEHKLDAPSGTAITTAQRIAAARDTAGLSEPAAIKETESAPGARGGRVDGVPVHSIRLPGSVAHQEVLFGGQGETLSIRHDTINREVFVPGVLLAVRAIAGHRGLVHGLETILWPVD
jgi:4-hydroxy-tetrahydrodipicolinate reductase